MGPVLVSSARGGVADLRWSPRRPAWPSGLIRSCHRPAVHGEGKDEELPEGLTSPLVPWEPQNDPRPLLGLSLERDLVLWCARLLLRIVRDLRR